MSVDKHATYVAYYDYDSDLRYVRTLYHLISQNKQNWADDTISIVVHRMVFNISAFSVSAFCSLYSAESGRVYCGLSVHSCVIYPSHSGLCDLSV